MADSIAKYAGYEKMYADKATLLDVTKLTEADLVVETVVDGFPLEEQLGVDPYGSNNGLVTDDSVLALEAVSSRPPDNAALVDLTKTADPVDLPQDA